MDHHHSREPGNTPASSKKFFSRTKDVSLIQEIGEFDGVDPRDEARKEHSRDRRNKRDYSADRLSRQMWESLSVGTALPSLEIFDGFAVASVSQQGTSNCYVVVVYHTDPTATFDPAAVKHELDRHRGKWRAAIGEAIVRKKVPDLTFEVLPPGVVP